MAIHPKGNICMMASLDGTVWLWNLNNGKVLQTIYAHQGEVTKVVFTPQKKIASCSEDGTLKIWKFGDPINPEIEFRKDRDN